MLAQIKQSDFASAKQLIQCPPADVLLPIVFIPNSDVLRLHMLLFALKSTWRETSLILLLKNHSVPSRVFSAFCKQCVCVCVCGGSLSCRSIWFKINNAFTVPMVKVVFIALICDLYVWVCLDVCVSACETRYHCWIMFHRQRKISALMHGDVRQLITRWLQFISWLYSAHNKY